MAASCPPSSAGSSSLSSSDGTSVEGPGSRPGMRAAVSPRTKAWSSSMPLAASKASTRTTGVAGLRTSSSGSRSPESATALR